ncbi:hypothetical protein Acr_01g0000140 [Actinidia rufa]|uniref:Uncharacterized protein n=1 Tax=Actinidia rufa TaxID=165716 RepID=A0A7J0E120_9ERIC|nr:hypothetical protein Acr_01g0000140 [Actinidia rufa]
MVGPLYAEKVFWLRNLLWKGGVTSGFLSIEFAHYTARSRPWRDFLPPPSHHLWPIGAPTRPVEGHRAKRKPFEVKSTLIGVESSLVRSVSKQISHNHSPRRRLTVGKRVPTRSGRVSTRSGRVSDELPRKKRRFAVLREIRHHLQDSCN